MWKKRLSRIAAFILVFASVNQLIYHTKAQELTDMYISSVSVGTAKELTNEGYTVIDNNINEGGTPVYVGYKLTSDPDEAITDISALSMYGGFSPLSYKDQLLNDSAGVTELGSQLMAAAEEFSLNYDDGNPYAQVAYDTLNVMMVPEDNGDETPLGEYIISDERTLSDFKKLGLMSSNVVMSFILNQLSMGTADDYTSGDGTWLDRLSENGPFVFTDDDGEALDEGSINEIYSTEYDGLYLQRAHRLYAAVSEFASNYTEAAQRSGSIETMVIPDEQEAAEAAQDVCDEISEGGSVEYEDDAEDGSVGGNDDYGDMMPLALYALLDAKDESGSPVYPYGTKEDGTPGTLAEFFVEVGSMEDDTDAYRRLYPLIAEQNGVTPLSAGQEAMTYLCGLTSMVSVACSDMDALEEARLSSEEQVDKILDINGGEKVSVWYDVNTDIYDESQDGVYWTSDLVREAAAHDRYDLLTKPTGIQDVDTQGKLNNAMIYIGCVGVAALGAAMVASQLLGAFTAVKGMIAMVSCGVKFLASTAMAYSTAACVSCVIGTVFIAILAIAIIAILVIAIIKLIEWLSEEEEELELTEIPLTIYDYNDSGEGSAVIYRSINTPGTDEPANLNAGLSNTPWVALYYTYDASLGEPITAIFDGDEITAQPIYFSVGNQNPDEGYCPLKSFGAVTAANLNEGRSGVKGVFGFYHRLGGEVSADEVEGMYLSELKLASASGDYAEETAKTELIDSGYAVVDFNLTSDSDVATYIGYKTSDDVGDALTDIRVAYSTGLDPKSATITYGGAQYGCCGNVGNLLLMESKWEIVGSPILAKYLVVTDTLGDAPEGYEPVNLFCGGPAFDFNNCGSWEMTSAEDGKESTEYWGSHAFIYFNPSEKYTSGEEYLGGLAFFSGIVNNHIDEMGWTVLNNENLDNGASDGGITYNLAGMQDGTTVLCYSTTYNPYRAIYDIRYYGAEASAQGLPYNITLANDGAVICDVFQQECGGVEENRMIRPSHAYRSNNWYEGGGYYEASDYIELNGARNRFSKDDKYAEWYEVDGTPTACNICCAGLYVVGKSSVNSDRTEPIRISELEVSASAEYDSDCMTPVRTITDCYANEGANLAFTDMYHDGSMYLYILREDEYAEIPEYVLSVTVADIKGYDLDNASGSRTPYDSAVYSLVGNGMGRLLEVNLTGASKWDENSEVYVHDLIAGYGEQEVYYTEEINVISHETKYETALVWVTYTATRSKGISDIVIYESDDGSLPSPLKAADGSTTDSCGNGFQINGKGTTYYLRAVYSMGNPITDLIIDDEVMLRNYWTSITTEGTASEYDVYFIKAKHFRKASLTYYISGIYTASGTSDTDAMKQLLNQGCRYFCPFNLSPDGKYPLYVGYSLATSYKKAYSGLILQDNGQDNTVDTIFKGRDTYTRVTDSLNSGVYDSIISMYLTNSVRKACETGGTKASNGHYITDITFYTDTDLNDYATGEKSLDSLDDRTREYVEDYIYDNDGDPVYWDIVTDSSGNIINCNITALKGGTLSETAPEVYMYIHYSDNETPYLESLSGSVIANNPEVSIIIAACGALVIAAGIYLVTTKNKSARKEKETDIE